MSSVPEQPSRPSDDDLSAAVEIARSFGAFAGHQHFAGVTTDPQTRQIVVYRRPHPDFDGPLLRLLEGRAEVQLRPARFTREELVDVREQIWTLDEVIEIDTIVLPVDGSALQVHVGGSLEAAQVALDQVALGVAVAVPAGTVAV